MSKSTYNIGSQNVLFQSEVCLFERDLKMLVFRWLRGLEISITMQIVSTRHCLFFKVTYIFPQGFWEVRVISTS